MSDRDLPSAPPASSAAAPETLPLRYAAAGALAWMQAGFRGLSRSRSSVRERSAALMRRALPSSGLAA